MVTTEEIMVTTETPEEIMVTTERPLNGVLRVLEGLHTCSLRAMATTSWSGGLYL